MTSIENLAEEWAVSSNDVFKILLYSDVDDKEPVTFGPVFTYPIYGDAETIYGFKDLVINVSCIHYHFPLDFIIIRKKKKKKKSTFYFTIIAF